MLTFFSTPKPFAGHIGVIQRNAIQSWQSMHPDAEVLLFGEEAGAAEAASALGVSYIPEVRRNAHGTKYLSAIFDRAQEVARHDLLCYVNCDILLLADFRRALEALRAHHARFLMIGRRWDTDITEPLDFAGPDCQEHIRRRALAANHRRPPQWIDYFVFARGLYQNQIPPFVIGRPGWDNWLVWFARASGVPVVDASSAVLAVHQNHDYSYHPDGEKGVWQGQEAQENYALLDRGRKFCTMENATHRLSTRGLRRNYWQYWAGGKKKAAALASRVWFSLLDLTRPIRHRLGLRSGDAGGTTR